MPMYGLKTSEAVVAQALLIVMRRGSLRATEEITGHKYETISTWLIGGDSRRGRQWNRLALCISNNSTALCGIGSLPSLARRAPSSNEMPTFDALVG